MKSDKGQATVEMALCLTVLVLLLFGMIDFGRIFHAYLTLDHAGREAARAASIGLDDSKIRESGLRAASSLDTTKVTFDLSPAPTDRKRGSYITVSLTYSVDIITPVMAKIIPNPYQLKNKTVMRVE
jgi:Flp pilus assembly protein TadG